MKKKDIIEFEVDKMEFGGTSVSMYGNREIHMKGGITGQKVKAAVKRTRSGKADVKMLELLEKSPIETADTCKHFGECGGCSILSVPYEKQLEIKEKQDNCKQDDSEIIKKIVKQFLSLKEPTPEVMKVIINRIEIHQDKQVDLYFNFKQFNNVYNKNKKIRVYSNVIGSKVK